MSEWDRDGDGLSNITEELRGTDPDKADTDGDGVRDGDEIDLGWDPTKADPPERVDRMRASLEIEHEKVDQAYEDARDMFRDTDGDGLDDYTERHKTGTNPFEADTDGDGLSDAFEVQYGLDPKDNLPDPPEPEPHVPMRLDDSLLSGAAATPVTPPPAAAEASPADLGADAGAVDSGTASYSTGDYSTDAYGTEVSTPDDASADADPRAGFGQPVDDALTSAAPDPVPDASSDSGSDGF
jgi:hypothetical protein